VLEYVCSPIAGRDIEQLQHLWGRVRHDRVPFFNQTPPALDISRQSVLSQDNLYYWFTMSVYCSAPSTVALSIRATSGPHE
jgi:hypothetical protein